MNHRINTHLCGSTAAASIHPGLWRFALAATHMSADFITSRVEINGPRHIWGPIRLSYHSSVCWLWLFGSCHWDSGRACSVIDQALLADRWSMVVGGAMDLSFSILSSSLFSSLCSPLVPGRDVYDASRRCTGWLTRAAGEAGRLAGWEIVTRTGVWHGRYTQTLLFALSPFSVQIYHNTIICTTVPSRWALCYKCAVWKLNQSMILENHLSLQGDPAVWFIIGTSLNDHLERNDQSKLLKDILSGWELFFTLKR